LGQLEIALSKEFIRTYVIDIDLANDVGLFDDWLVVKVQAMFKMGFVTAT